MRIYIVRHGESEANTLSEFSNRVLKHGLTAKGRQQVAALAHKLQGENIVAIYSSPLLRAVETAQILADKFGTPYRIADALIEYDVGMYEGRSDEAGWNRYAEVLDEWMVQGLWDARMEEGESFNEIRARFLPFIETLKEEYRGERGSIMLVGHGGTYRCMLPLVLSNVDFPFSLAHTIGHTSFVLTELHGDKLVCSKWGDMAFPP